MGADRVSPRKEGADVGLEANPRNLRIAFIFSSEEL